MNEPNLQLRTTHRKADEGQPDLWENFLYLLWGEVSVTLHPLINALEDVDLRGTEGITADDGFQGRLKWAGRWVFGRVKNV